jgi:hypothetical protein
LSRRKPHSLLVLGSLSLALAACGGSSKPKAATTVPRAPGAGSSAITTGGIHATLTADSHAPVVNTLFSYTVSVADATGRPLAGTVDTEFAFSGVVVGAEVPPTHPLKNGLLHDSVTFPSTSLGQPLELQTVVHTSKGSVTLDWPVMSKR